MIWDAHLRRAWKVQIPISAYTVAVVTCFGRLLREDVHIVA